MRKQVIISILTLVALNTTIPLCNNTSALTSQNNTNIEFTLNPTLSLSLSGSLSLLGLQPGTSADSNVITIDIGTNNVTGYTLSANVGNSTNNTTSLTNTNDNHYTFTNLSSSISSLSDFNDNEWGYSYSVDNGTNWLSGDIASPSNGYGGLPIYSSTNSPKLNETYSPSNDSIKFKIGAKSASNQVAGTYTNVVNFMAVTNAVPMSISDAFALAGAEQVNGYYTMQDMTSSICGAVQVYDEDSQTQLIDVRDHKVYWVAKLRDNHCWMTQNLDLDLDSTVALTSEDTDLNEFGANNYDTANGYACSNVVTTTNCTAEGEIISWLPERGTINAMTDDNTRIGSMAGWLDSNNDPYSVDTGDWYWDGSRNYSSDLCYINANSRMCDYVSKTGNTYATYFSTMPYSANGAHGHVGNYYNWAAFIASNDSGSFSGDTSTDPGGNPKNSVCSSGWRLPIITTNYLADAIGTNDFYNLNLEYNGSSIDTSAGLMTAPIYFIRAGYVYGKALHNAGVNGFYWSSTATGDMSGNFTRSYRLDFGSAWANVQSTQNRLLGMALRCIAR